jgi:hypothetical protein
MLQPDPDPCERKRRQSRRERIEMVLNYRPFVLLPSSQQELEDVPTHCSALAHLTITFVQRKNVIFIRHITDVLMCLTFVYTWLRHVCTFVQNVLVPIINGEWD